MKLVKTDYFSFILILIISLFFVLELFLFPGRPANFDSNFHITNMAQFSSILSKGEFPVIWMNNFANYGIPMGLFAHQTTNYLGGVITLITNNPTTSYNIVTFLGIFLSNIFLYIFLRLYFSPLASFLGTFIFNFTPYRIFNIYVRGAMPEVFSALFLPLILIAFYLLVVKKKTYAFFLLVLFIAGLTLTHPMMLVVYSILFLPYLIFLLLSSDLDIYQKIKLFIIASSAILLGILISGYYVLPLNLEIKYFYYGFIKNHIDKSTYLSVQNFFNPNWYYFTKNEIFPRGHVVLFGLLESLILISGFLYLLLRRFINKSQKNIKILYFSLVSSLLIIFFTTGFSDIFFQKLFFLNSIQFPWRFLSSLIFIPPIIIAFLYDCFPKRIILFLLVLTVSFSSFPQLYGKNFNVYPMQTYFFSKENAHSILMNTIWTGKSEDYPDKNQQEKIIEGQGKIINAVIKNSSRNYQIQASTPLKMEDLTFYFPGWNVYIDGVKTNIEFQNPSFRGVITYTVPAGKHDVFLNFEDTKIRLFGKILSLIFLTLFVVLIILRKRVFRILKF